MAFALLAAVGLLAAIIAAVAGFGIGSLLTPAMTTVAPAKVAVAAVAIPHVFATAYRFWLIREHLDMPTLKSFGLMSAAGGLSGALLGSIVSSRALELVLAALLVFVGLGGLFGFANRIRFTGPWAWVAGAVSGFLGGMVGNQGGLRSGAMLGMQVPRDAYVATATATGLLVDGARLPVYLALQWRELLPLLPHILAMCGAVVVGTWLGMRLLRRIPEERFLQVVSALLLGIAVWLVTKESWAR